MILELTQLVRDKQSCCFCFGIVSLSQFYAKLNKHHTAAARSIELCYVARCDDDFFLCFFLATDRIYRMSLDLDRL